VKGRGEKLSEIPDPSRERGGFYKKRGEDVEGGGANRGRSKGEGGEELLASVRRGGGGKKGKPKRRRNHLSKLLDCERGKRRSSALHQSKKKRGRGKRR